MCLKQESSSPIDANKQYRFTFRLDSGAIKTDHYDFSDTEKLFSEEKRYICELDGNEKYKLKRFYNFFCKF